MVDKIGLILSGIIVVTFYLFVLLHYPIAIIITIIEKAIP
jgi:hypothetical protein